MSAADILERYGWWASLNHGGLLIAPSKLAERFPEGLPQLARPLSDRLRRDLVRLREGNEGALGAFLDTVLEDVLDLHKARWIQGSTVDKSWTRTSVTRDAIRPRRVWLGPHDTVLPVFVADKEEGALRLGIGRGKREVSRVVEWLRKANHKVALLAGGRHLRLIHAGTDYDAFCEWDTDLWFQEGAPGPQVTAIRALLSREAIVPGAEGKPSRLIAAIQATRQGQAELSTALGERVRLAVETLISESAGALEPLDTPGPNQVSRRDIYIAATRLIMRCVVILFAESRQDDLLPRNNPIYEQSYGLGSLRNQLDRLAGGRAAERLRHSHTAWPRLLSLFALLYHGSAHEALPVTRYGGGLFMPGDPAATKDPVLRALAAFEGPENAPSDAAMHRILDLLCKSQVKVRQGRSSRWVEAPVDFSDLSSEYLGILYEGLLDFELRRAPEDDAMVFLNLGDEPVLPISRLDRMNNEELAQLLEKLAKSAKKSAPDEEDAEGEDEGEEDEGEEDEARAEGEDEGETAAPEGTAEVEGVEDGAHTIREKIQLWAERAVKAAKLVKYPKKDTDPRVREQFNQEVTARARSLIRRAVLPGFWYLVRWGGTRKGSGTFYTRPQLAGPIVRRALEPLAFDAVSRTKDEATGIETVTEWAPKKPEAILALKVCDPAMGSGSFLISALRYLTGALYESLHLHGRIDERPDGVIPRLADGLPADHPWNEPLPVPREHPEFEKRLKARLKRHVVERCIYGVDLDPLAVELAKTALWIETMDPRLPFGFVDHKLKCGNSLVGCWFDRFQDYPIMAWEREGGDKGHERFVHHFRDFVVAKGKDKGKTRRAGDKWTAAIKERRDDVIKPEFKRWLEERFSKQVKFEFAIDGKTAEVLHDEALAVFEKMHALPVQDAEGRERMYREQIVGNSAIQRLREAFDTWCALWFWPGDDLEKAPGPMTLLAPDDAAREVVRRVKDKERSFHWEIEFPDVFARPGSGFDAMVGNPPWEIQKPNSKEFFSNIDPLYRTYGKQEALEHQSAYFDDVDDVERSWVAYCAQFKSITNWVDRVGSPAETSATTKESARRRSYADPEHPFVCQGTSDVNTYKLFLELAHVLSSRCGIIGFLVPAGVYTDTGSKALRDMFLRRSTWTHLYAFQNERFAFEHIHHGFKVAILHIKKERSDVPIMTRFRIGPGDSPEVSEIEVDMLGERAYLPMSSADVARFSPKAGTILEVRSRRDLQTLEKLYHRSVTFGDQGPGGWGVRYSREFHMGDDAGKFRPLAWFQERGYAEDERGLYRTPEGDTAFPFLEGRSIDHHHCFSSRWLSGKGRRAKWQDNEPGSSSIGAQYLMPVSLFAASSQYRAGNKVGVMDVTSATNTRSAIAALLPGIPTGDSVKNAQVGSGKSLSDSLALCAFIDSYVFDYALRIRLGGVHLSEFIMGDVPLPPRQALPWVVSRSVLGLNGVHPLFAPQWLSAVSKPTLTIPWRRLWAVTPHERLRLRSILDAVVAELYGLDIADFAWILRDCDHPTDRVCDKPFSRTLDPKGFWRVDKDKDPELRHPVLSLVAFHELKRLGLDTFLAQNDGEGWMLPERLRLADYSLGHDARAREPQPVAARLGGRFLPWQLEQGVEESWEECRRHAETIEKILGPLAPQKQAALATAATPRAEKQLTLEFATAPPPATIGATLRVALERAGLSQSDFAANAGIDLSVVAALAACIAPLDPGNRNAMAAAVREQSPKLSVAKVMRSLDALIAILPGSGSEKVQMVLKAARKPL